MAYINIFRSVKNTPASYDPVKRPLNDDERVKALRKYGMMDSPSEEIFSAYTELAALTFRVPIALMSFIDADTTFYKQAYGVERTGQLVPRKNSPCSIAIVSDEITQFRYALSDPCVLADEKNLAEAGYKFYTGAPLRTVDGFNIGMLAVVDKVPRTFSEEELNQLKQLAFDVMKEVEIRLESTTQHYISQLNERLNILHKRVEKLRTPI